MARQLLRPFALNSPSPGFATKSSHDPCERGAMVHTCLLPPPFLLIESSSSMQLKPVIFMVVASNVCRKFKNGFKCFRVPYHPLAFMAALVLCLGFAREADAQSSTYYWDQNKTLAGTGGTGNWSGAAAETYWTADGNTGHVLWNGTGESNSVAEFGGTAGTVSLTNSYNAYSLVFTVGGYSIQTGSTTNRSITLTSGMVRTDTGTTTFASGNGAAVKVWQCGIYQARKWHIDSGSIGERLHGGDDSLRRNVEIGSDGWIAHQ